MARRIMRAFKMNEISAVDRPAQPEAKALIMKRAGDPVQKDMYGVSRFADLLGSLGYLLSSAEDESAYEGDRSPVPAALRSWLKQGLPIFRAMATEEVDEFIAASLAKQTGAASIKHEGGMVSKLFGFVKGFGVSTAALSESVKSIVDDDKATNKAALIDETINQFSEHLEGEIEKALSGGKPGETSEDDQVSIAIMKALGLADTASEDDALNALAKMQIDAEIAKAAMTDDEKSFHDKIDGAEAQKAFRALSKDDRAKKMAKSVDELPESVRKALADVEILKRDNAALLRERDLAKFGKRAVEIGLSEAQGELLMKAHAGDKEALAKIENAIKGLNEQIATGKLFTEFGTSKGGEVDAYSEITAKAQELRKADPKLTIEKAKAKVIEDPANRELVKRYNEERMPKATTRAA